MKRSYLLVLAGFGLIACSTASPLRWNNTLYPRVSWKETSFASNGERIYFTATNEGGETIDYRGGAVYGGMMMQPRLTCASCHGTDGSGGRHIMHMQVMEAPDIRYAALISGEDEHEGDGESMEHDQAVYDLDMFRQAVVEGKHPDGEALSTDMPRWEMSDQDLADLFEYLESMQ